MWKISAIFGKQMKTAMKDIRTICSEKLKILANNITAAEKVEAMNTIGISRPTLDKYLNGKIALIETAMQLVQFFTSKVNQRLEELRETNVA